jgi:hypothetical protein
MNADEAIHRSQAQSRKGKARQNKIMIFSYSCISLRLRAFASRFSAYIGVHRRLNGR